MRGSTFRSGRLPMNSTTTTPSSTNSTSASPSDASSPRTEKSPTTRRGRRGRGRQSSIHPASRTLDLGKLGRDEDLGIHEGAPAQLRSGGIAAFFRALFSRSDDTRTRPRRGTAAETRYYSTPGGAAPGGGPPGHGHPDMTGGGHVHPQHHTATSSGRLVRHAAASSLGSLQSYATSTIRASSGPLPSCLSQGSTSEVSMKKRVIPRKDRDDEPVFSKAVRDVTLLSKRPERVSYPNFALADFGSRESWASDVFVLPHNAIRWEVMDLYTILSSLQRRWATLTLLDVWELSEYWEVFEVFVAQYFEIEDQIVFPYMLNIASESTDLKRYHKVVNYNRDRLESLLREVSATLEQFNTNPAGDVLPKLYTQLAEYLPQLLDYMEQQENVLPEVFRVYCDPEDRQLLNRASANFIVRAANGRDGIAILTRWIEDSMILQVWKNENLSSRAQVSHKRWIANLETTHVDIAKRFQRRMRSMPKSDGDEKSGNGGHGMADRMDHVVADGLSGHTKNSFGRKGK